MSEITDRYNVLMKELAELHSSPLFTDAKEDALMSQLDTLWDAMSVEEWAEIRKLHVAEPLKWMDY